MSPEGRIRAARRLSKVAVATAFLVREGVINVSNYSKALHTWVSKNAYDDAQLHLLCDSAPLAFAEVSNAAKPWVNE